MSTVNRDAPVEPGGVVRVLLDTTDDRRVIADVTAEAVDLLKCGCWRVRAARPGPDVGPYTCWDLEVLFRVCGYPHDDGSAEDGTVMPAPVVVKRTA